MIEALEHRGLWHVRLWRVTHDGVLGPGVDRHVRDATRAAHRVGERSPHSRQARDGRDTPKLAPRLGDQVRERDAVVDVASDVRVEQDRHRRHAVESA